ncbi:hypothetical protein TI01_1916 [Lysobacter sp. A03]|nr:hypothetical protein TI01_1916 [Lysobacter sp. A03]
MAPESTTPAATADTAVAPGETVAQLIALDQQAVAMAEQARQHEQLDPPVAELAEQISIHHRRNLTQTRALGDAEALDVTDTPTIRNQRVEEEKRLKAMGELDADAYRRGYLDAVVETHEQALEWIGERLEATDNEAIRKHLERTRDNFEDHMKAAMALRDN